MPCSDGYSYSGPSPRLTSETIAATTPQVGTGNECDYSAVAAACGERSGESGRGDCDEPACLQAQCAYVRCLRDNGYYYCTNCGCGDGGGGVGQGSGDLPIGGGCPGCPGGGIETPDTGDIFGAHFGPAGSGGGGGGMGGLGGGMFRPGGSIWDFVGPMQYMHPGMNPFPPMTGADWKRYAVMRDNFQKYGDALPDRLTVCCCRCRDEGCTPEMCAHGGPIREKLAELSRLYSKWNKAIAVVGAIGVVASFSLPGYGLVIGFAALIVMALMYMLALLRQTFELYNNEDDALRSCIFCIGRCMKELGVGDWDEYGTFFGWGLAGLAPWSNRWGGLAWGAGTDWFGFHSDTDPIHDWTRPLIKTM